MTALPYGLRDMKITPYSDAGGTTLASTSIDLPYGRTLSFTEAEEFNELRGDDSVVTTRGQGAAVEWEFESGGFSFEAMAAMFGGTVVESGVAPNTNKTWTKTKNDARPFFKLEGQAISDSGGDVHCVMYRCRATGDFEGEFADGEFWLSTGSGAALPSLLSGSEDVLYDFIQNATATAIA